MRLLAPVSAVFFLAVAVLHPSAVSFDGLSFLRGAREGWIDYGHALYPPLLAAAQGLLGDLLPAERVARLVSALGALLAFVLLWRRVQHGGAPPLLAGLVALCWGCSTLLWQEAGSVEPTTWTVASLLLAGNAAERYARAPDGPRLALLALAFGAALGFHLVSFCALPWLVSRSRPELGAWPRAHLLAPVAAALLGATCCFVLDEDLARYFRYWSGFVPDFAGGPWSVLARHARRGARLAFEGAPVLVACALLAPAWSGRATLREGLWLAGPYLLAFLLFGKPLVGLLVPAFLGAALVLGAACAQAHRSGRARAFGWALGLAAGLQLGLSLPQALAWRRAPDEPRVQAELLVRHLPSGVLLFAGSLANHLRYYWPALEIVSLPELWHQAHARDRSSDPLEVVRRAVEASGRRCALSSDGAGFLLGLSADPARLGLTIERALLIPEDPRLALFPLNE